MLQFGIAFVASERAEAAGEALAAAGFSTEVQRSGLDFVLSVTCDQLPRGWSFAQASARMAKIAGAFHGDYMGHGGFFSTGTSP